MQLGNGDRSNVEDRRGLGGAGMKLGLGGTLLLAVLSLVFGRNLLPTDGGEVAVGPGPAAPEQVEQRKATEGKLEEVAVASFNDAQELWGKTIKDYRPAKLVLFWDGTQSGCGDASAAMGPFYCPLDQRVYIDLGFYRELARRFGATGEFAQAYVIAHEVGHHVQNVVGIASRVHGAQERAPEATRNALSVKLELQADCLAGAWARSVGERGRLDPGDVEAGLRAAAAVGDDRIQKATRGSVRPESFTHGSAAQRATWFRRGYDGGSARACDTFSSEGTIDGDDASLPSQARRPAGR